jgi:hypothetical protein
MSDFKHQFGYVLGENWPHTVFDFYAALRTDAGSGRNGWDLCSAVGLEERQELRRSIE